VVAEVLSHENVEPTGVAGQVRRAERDQLAVSAGRGQRAGSLQVLWVEADQCGRYQQGR